MAQLLLEPFAGYAIADINQIFGNVTEGINAGSSDSFVTTAPSRPGAQYLQLRTSAGAGNKSSKFYQIVPQYPVVTGNVAIFGFRIKSLNFANLFTGGGSPPMSSSQANCLFSLWKAGTLQVWAGFNTDGTISFYRGTTLITGATTSVALAVTTWTYLEFKVTVRTGTNGTIDVKMNGLTSILSITGQNTANAGSDGWTSFALPQVAGNSALIGYDLHDLYLADGNGSVWNDFMGELRVDACLVNGVGSNNMSTPSTGTDRSLTVDDPTMNGDTDYNTFSAINDKDTYAMQDAPVAGGTILGVETRSQMRKVAAGSAAVKHVLRVNGVDYLGVENNLPSSYGVIRQPWSVNPGTGVAWVDAGVSGWNTSEAGVLKSV